MTTTLRARGFCNWTSESMTIAADSFWEPVSNDSSSPATVPLMCEGAKPKPFTPLLAGENKGAETQTKL